MVLDQLKNWRGISDIKGVTLSFGEWYLRKNKQSIRLFSEYPISHVIVTIRILLDCRKVNY